MKDAYSNIYLKSVIRRILLFRLKSSVLLCVFSYMFVNIIMRDGVAVNLVCLMNRMSWVRIPLPQEIQVQSLHVAYLGLKLICTKIK